MKMMIETGNQLQEEDQGRKMKENLQTHANQMIGRLGDQE